ncbi:MAG: response regulator [Sphingomonadaceae bacterium]
MPKTSAPDRRSALIIDDHRELADLLAERLSLDGFDPMVATTAREGLSLFRQRGCDVAFVDLKLPDMSGVTVAAELRKRSAGLKVILITGFATTVDDSEPGWTQFDGVLPKPWRPTELETILRAVGKGRR